MSEPRTHYDDNDAHTYTMHDVIMPPEMTDLKKFDLASATHEEVMDHLAMLLEKEELVTIDGLQYKVTSFTPLDNSGRRKAVLELWSPF